MSWEDSKQPGSATKQEFLLEAELVGSPSLQVFVERKNPPTWFWKITEDEKTLESGSCSTGACSPLSEGSLDVY